MTTARGFIDQCLAQKGDKYVFGAEVDLRDPNPSKFDCSELVQWAAARVGISPPVPDGAVNQYGQARQMGLLIPVDEAIKTPGTLLYMGDGKGSGRDSIWHVAVSLGNGYTIEARGKQWGVGVWSATRGFDFASKLPGIDYRGGSVPAEAQVRTVIGLGDKGPDVKFVQAMFNIIIPAIAKAGYTNGQPLEGDGVWGPATASVNRSFEKFWNEHGPGKDDRAKRLQQDDNFTLKGSAPALAALVQLVLAQKK